MPLSDWQATPALLHWATAQCWFKSTSAAVDWKHSHQQCLCLQHWGNTKQLTATLPTTTVSLSTMVFLSPSKEKSHLTFWEKSRPSYTEPWFWYCHKGLCLQPNTNWDAVWKQPCYFYFLPSVFSSLHAEGFWHWFHNTAQMFYESPLVCGLHAEKHHSRKLSTLN